MKIPHGIRFGAIAILLTGCASMKRLPPPGNPLVMAEIPGIPGCRIWGDNPPIDETERRALLVAQIKASPQFDPREDIHMLAISGGAQEGAFGAGVLTGWTASGERPQFQVVTGISAGSLLAPFAFLGPDYDQVLQDLSSKYETRDLIDSRYLGALFRGSSLSTNKKVRKLLTTYFTPVEMERIAQEYAMGRRLFIGSTHLDTVRPVIWDIGAIAASGDPKAYDLIVDAILASAAFPGVFPPVIVDVEQDGVPYQELHVDGGLTSQVFAYALDTDIRKVLEELGVTGRTHVYVLRNAVIVPRVKEISPRTIPILMQTAFSMVNTLALMNIQYIYHDALEDGMVFHLAYIPSDFREPAEMYDPSYMMELFDLGYQRAKAGYPWETQPPLFWQQSTRPLE